MKCLIHSLTAWLRGSSLRVPAHADPQGPRLPILFLVLTLPFLVSGPIRTLSQLSLPISLLVAMAICAAASVLLWPRLMRTLKSLRRPSAWVSEGASLLVIGFAVWALYNSDFGGFMNLDGWDGGTHVVIKDQFATVAPGWYQGQVSSYALAWWLERILRIDAFRSFTIVFYVAVVAVAAFPLVVAFALTRASSLAGKLPGLVATAVTVLGMVGVMLAVVLPLLHYDQAAGYYPQVFGLALLMALWAADAMIHAPRTRIVVLLCGFVLVRYTYALNLADIAIALAVIILLERFQGWWRIAQVAIVLGLFAAAYLIIEALLPAFHMWGGIQGFNMDRALEANLLLVGAMGLYVLANSWRLLPRFWLGSPLFAAIRFPLFFGLTTSALFSCFRQVKSVRYYYMLKYQMWACVLLASAFVVILFHLSFSLARWSSARKPSLWLRTLLVIVSLVTVSVLWIGAFAGYRTTLQERMLSHGPPYRYLRPLADVEAIARIGSVLSSKNKQFGGYLTAFFPMFSFMNATLGHHAGYQDFFPPAISPGFCVFWVTKERDIYRLGPADKLDALRSQVAAAGSTCSEYRVPWKTTPQSLCYHCY
jgi:hypothetical protein